MMLVLLALSNLLTLVPLPRSPNNRSTEVSPRVVSEHDDESSLAPLQFPFMVIDDSSFFVNRDEFVGFVLEFCVR